MNHRTLILSALFVLPLLAGLSYAAPTAAACHWDIYDNGVIDQTLSGPKIMQGPWWQPYDTRFDASHGVHSGHRHDIHTHWYVEFCVDKHKAFVNAIFSTWATTATLQVKFIDSGMSITSVSSPPASWASIAGGGVGNNFVTLRIEGSNFQSRVWDFEVIANIPRSLWGTYLTLDFTLANCCDSRSWTETVLG